MPRSKVACVCGCWRPWRQKHHVIYRQELRRRATEDRKFSTLLKDDRNLVKVAVECHASHHSAMHPLRLSVLPDSCFEFATELMGAGPAHEYLRRRYAGDDERLRTIVLAATDASMS